MVTAAGLASKHVPASDYECEIAALLQEAGHHNAQAAAKVCAFMHALSAQYLRKKVSVGNDSILAEYSDLQIEQFLLCHLTNVTHQTHLQVDNELGRGKYSADEWQKKQDALARNNALLFYQESKAKRLKKIKSKAYHRHLKKSGTPADSATAALDDPATLLVRTCMYIYSSI